MTTPDTSNDFPESSMIAMIGLLPLPGSPAYGGSEQAVIDKALEDADTFKKADVDALLIENSGDLPYIKPPLADEALQLVEQIAHMVRMRNKVPIGLQLLEAANEDAMRIAASCNLDFIRAEGYVFAHIGGAGLIEGSAGKILRLRKRLRSENIRVFADVRKKHCAHAITGDLDIEDHVRQAEFFQADGIIVTGPRTGSQPDESDVTRCRSACGLAILIGSGMNVRNLKNYFDLADGFIVGSDLRRNGEFLEPLCRDRLEVFMEEFRRLKSAQCTE